MPAYPMNPTTHLFIGMLAAWSAGRAALWALKGIFLARLPALRDQPPGIMNNTIFAAYFYVILLEWLS